MVLAMVLAGLRRCEVLGLRLADVRVADRRLFDAEGKGGHQRVIPVADRFLGALGDYLHDERPATASTDRVFVVLKGPGHHLTRDANRSAAATGRNSLTQGSPKTGRGGRVRSQTPGNRRSNRALHWEAGGSCWAA